MKSVLFFLYFMVISLNSIIYSQIVNEGEFTISASTTVSFLDEYTNKSTGNFINNGTLSLQGNYINNGLITSVSGTTFFNNSNLESQSISGTANEINFFNLVIDNVSEVTQSINAVVSNYFLINLGNSYSISPGIQLTVNGDISNLAGNNGLVLKSNNTGTASIIHNTDNIAATVERYISGASEDWHFLASPVSNQPIASSNWVPSGTYGNGTGYDMYVWDESTPCWVYQLNTTTAPSWSTVHPSENFVTARGYLYSVQQSNPTFNFQGTLNNGTVSYATTADNTTDVNLKGFNLIGNPYPSAIDWKAISGWTRDNLVASGGGYDMWIWNPTANNYGVFNSNGSTGTNNVTQYIPSMQGFFVRAESNANLTMTNNIRLHSVSSYWMKTKTKKSIKNLKVKIESKSGLGFDEVLFQFGHSENKPGATKLFSSVKSALSVFTQSGLDNLSVKYLTDTNQNASVPISFVSGANGDYKLTVDLNDSNFEYLTLEDKKTKTLHDLLTFSEYSFNSSVNDPSDRFTIHFMSKELVLNENILEVPIYYNGKNIIIDLSTKNSNTQVEVFNLIGKKIISKNLDRKRVHYLTSGLKKQLYIVTLRNKNKSIRKKIIVY